MDRITHQSPRQRGYGSTSSLRNDSLKHTRKHEKEREESNQEANHSASGGPSGQARRTVRDGPRGPSGRVPRTVRTLAADCPARAADRPLKRTEPPVANLEKRTVRGEHADCPPGTRGPSTRYTRTVRNFVQPKLKATTVRNEKRARTRRTPDEQHPRGPSADTTRTVRPSRTEQKNARPRRSTPPNHHRIYQTVEAVETRVWGLEKLHTRML
jgi:hypothetical protein